MIMKTTLFAGFILFFSLSFHVFAGCTGDQIEKMIKAGFTKSEIMSLCKDTPTPDPVVQPEKTLPPAILKFNAFQFNNDFPGGSRIVYTADFSKWPRKANQDGIARFEENGYILEAVSNTWVGPGQLLPIAPALNRNYILDIAFQVIHKTSASLSITLSDAGTNYSQVEFFFDIWQNGTPTYSIYENWVKNNFYVTVRRKFAERVPVKINTEQIKWNSSNTLTVKRENRQITFYLNGLELERFSMPAFTVKKIGTGLAFKSKVRLISIKARVPKS